LTNENQPMKKLKFLRIASIIFFRKISPDR
jgi:hypothetical protein